MDPLPGLAFTFCGAPNVPDEEDETLDNVPDEEDETLDDAGIRLDRLEAGMLEMILIVEDDI